MPEKIEKKPCASQVHYEQEQLAQYSYEVSESSENDYYANDYDDDGGDEEQECERDDDSTTSDDEELQDIGELLGFRITGGKDFFMPITIFHVKEESRAEKANLKLGDAILSINGRDTDDMTLVRANRYLAKVADGDVTLQVAKFNPNDEDDDVQTIEEVVLEGPVSLQQRLKQMQQQLLDVSDIPPQIQSKMAMLTKALEQFMTMDPEALEASWKEAAADEEEEEREAQEEEEQEVDETTFEVVPSTRETSYSFEDLVNGGDEERNCEQYDQCEEEEFSCNEEEQDEEEDDDELKTEEQLELAAEKRKKNEKIQTLQKSWQKLCENQKTIHKRSNCHLVPSTALLHNKINQLNESKVISFYERKRNPQ